NLTEEQKIEINKFVAKVITKIRQTLGVTAPEVLATSYTIKAANEQAEKYLRRGRTIHEWLTGSVENQSNAHIGHPYGLDNLSTTGAGYSPKTMSELKKHVFNTLIGFTFEDKNSNWGHA
ncbi:SEC10/PgrA surface exclusion domain-containing protein, partial [Streptococcus suis]